MRDICVEKIHGLGEYGLIWTDEDGFLIKPLEPGRLMTKFYLKFDTMKLIVKASACCSLEDLLHIICRSAEISWIQLRRNEKKTLNDINTDKEGRLRFHVLTENGKKKKRIMTREDKIFVLANDCLTGDPLMHDLSFNQETNSICSNGCRIAKCMKEYFIYKRSYRSAINSMVLTKCLDQKLWESSPFLLKQLTGIGIVTAKVVGSEEDNMILFHEKIRAHEFSSPYYVKLCVPCPQDARVTLKADLIFEEHVGIDIHKKHVVSREDDLHVTKAYGTEKPNPLSNLPADICLASSRTTQDHLGRSPLSKEICVIEDDDGVNAPDKADNILGTRKFNNLASLEVPSFDLLLEEDNGDTQDVSFYEPVEAECKGATSNTIFDHIRKKSRDFPTLTLSKSMDSSYEPLILKKMKTSRDQFDLDQGSLHANEVTPMDSEHTELTVSPTNTAEKCRRILGRSSEKSCSLFAEKIDSPFEKSKILTRSPYEISLQFAGRRDSPSEKSKILSRIANENSLQFAARRDSLSEKTKVAWTTPDENNCQFAGKMDSLSEKSEILIRPPVDNTLQFAGKMDSLSEKSKVLIIPPHDNTLQFVGRRDSPSEKSKFLSRTSDENCLQFAGKIDGSSEKSNVLSRTPDVNSLQFAGRRDSPPEKNKLCFSSPFPDFQAMQCTKQVPASVQPLRIQEYCKDILASSKGSEFKSVFSFL